ncbi:hypothetical protein ACWB3E_19915, partial [Acinetobacter baumannii]
MKMQSLSNHQIQDHLLRSGFTKIPPKDPNNYKVIGFKKPHLHHPIYVKATNNFPLVIHDTYDAIRPKLLKIDGVHVDSGKEYYNSNMKEFNKKISVHDKFHRILVLSGFFFLKIASTFLNSSFFPKPIKR